VMGSHSSARATSFRAVFYRAVMAPSGRPRDARQHVGAVRSGRSQTQPASELHSGGPFAVDLGKHMGRYARKTAVLGSGRLSKKRSKINARVLDPLFWRNLLANAACDRSRARRTSGLGAARSAPGSMTPGTMRGGIERERPRSPIPYGAPMAF
jgi:hypothetical protein